MEKRRFSPGGTTLEEPVPEPKRTPLIRQMLSRNVTFIFRAAAHRRRLGLVVAQVRDRPSLAFADLAVHLLAGTSLDTPAARLHVVHGRRGRSRRTTRSYWKASRRAGIGGPCRWRRPSENRRCPPRRAGSPSRDFHRMSPTSCRPPQIRTSGLYKIILEYLPHKSSRSRTRAKTFCIDRNDATPLKGE